LQEEMKMRVVVIIGGPALLIAAAVVVVTALRNRQQSAPPPDVPVSASSAEVRVKAVERNSAANVATVAFHNKTVSSAGNCGIMFTDESNADKCEK
jgi:hypothetical protein